MLTEALHLIPYALVAALSPLGFAATLAVLESGRLKALGFAIGFVSGQLLACAVLVAIGGAAPERSDRYPTLQALLELGLGLVVLWLALEVRRKPQPMARKDSGKRSSAMLERLGRLRVGTAIVAGFLLGIGGPKRLVLTALAAASITAASLDGSADVLLVAWYAALATVLVWIPVLAFELFGEQAIIWFDRAHEWLSVHQRQVVAWALAILGLVLVADGLLALA